MSIDWVPLFSESRLAIHSFVDWFQSSMVKAMNDKFSAMVSDVCSNRDIETERFIDGLSAACKAYPTATQELIKVWYIVWETQSAQRQWMRLSHLFRDEPRWDPKDKTLARHGLWGSIYHFRTPNGAKMVAKYCAPPTSEKHWLSMCMVLNEICALRDIPRHPRIVDLCGTVTEGKTCGYVTCMEDFNALAAFKSGLLGDPFVPLSIAQDVASALAHIHNHGYAHGDVAARNVLCRVYIGDGYMTRIVGVVCDFGLAVKVGKGESAKMFVQGFVPAPWSQPPEALLHCVVSHATDVYMYGCLLYELYTGKSVFNGQSTETVRRWVIEGGRPQVSIPSIPQEIQRIIHRCWLQDASMRPKMEDIHRELEAVKRVLPQFHDFPLVQKIPHSSLREKHSTNPPSVVNILESVEGFLYTPGKRCNNDYYVCVVCPPATAAFPIPFTRRIESTVQLLSPAEYAAGEKWELQLVIYEGRMVVSTVLYQSRLLIEVISPTRSAFIDILFGKAIRPDDFKELIASPVDYFRSEEP